MARPREFETDDALEGAMQVFWQFGYQDASLPDLLDGMGLTRGSLYKAFKDKKNLFLLVLNRYETENVDAAVAMLKDQSVKDGQNRILSVFASILEAVAKGDHRGCLLCTTTGSAAADDPDIAQVVQDGLIKMQDGFEYALSQSPKLAGQSQESRRLLANTLLTQYIGLRMLVRSQLPLGVLEKSIEGIDTLLDGAA
jgi:TetR/AcrR family transcriptional repressor of nem operon